MRHKEQLGSIQVTRGDRKWLRSKDKAQKQDMGNVQDNKKVKILILKSWLFLNKPNYIDITSIKSEGVDKSCEQ